MLNSENQMQFIVNQDRDYIVPKTNELRTMPQVYKNSIVGINLYMTLQDGSMLCIGTFDSVDEAIAEMERILVNDDEIYAVSGFEQEEQL